MALIDYYAIHFVHLILGVTLFVLAIRSYQKTRISAMFYLILAFFALGIGHIFADLYFYGRGQELYSEIFDIIGLSALIIAVKKISD